MTWEHTYPISSPADGSNGSENIRRHDGVSVTMLHSCYRPLCVFGGDACVLACLCVFVGGAI